MHCLDLNQDRRRGLRSLRVSPGGRREQRRCRPHPLRTRRLLARPGAPARQVQPPDLALHRLDLAPGRRRIGPRHGSARARAERREPVGRTRALRRRHVRPRRTGAPSTWPGSSTSSATFTSRSTPLPGSPSAATSAKATAAANGFGLDEWNRNLHAFWDGALDGRFRADHRQQALATLTSDSNRPPPPEQFWGTFGELRDREYEAHKDRIAAEARSRHPLRRRRPGQSQVRRLQGLGSRVQPDRPQHPLSPRPHPRRSPSRRLRRTRAYDLSLQRAALAGYRLADLLTKLLGD